MKNRPFGVKIGMTTMDAKVFVDTNIVLRTYNEQLANHSKAKELLFSQVSAGAEVWISRQIIREYLVQASHPKTFLIPLGMSRILTQLESIQDSFRIADETAEVTAQLLDLLKTYPTGGKQIHDANIVATMLVNGVDTLLTMNVADFRRFEGRINILPLQAKTP